MSAADAMTTTAEFSPNGLCSGRCCSTTATRTPEIIAWRSEVRWRGIRSPFPSASGGFANAGVEIPIPSLPLLAPSLNLYVYRRGCRPHILPPAKRADGVGETGQLFLPAPTTSPPPHHFPLTISPLRHCMATSSSIIKTNRQLMVCCDARLRYLSASCSGSSP